MSLHRLTLELDEETHAQWEAAAKRIDYDRLDVWARDTLDAASDPDAGQVVDLAARLSAAETERQRLEDDLQQAGNMPGRIAKRHGWLNAREVAELREEVGRADAHRLAAEARVEALLVLLAREMYARNASEDGLPPDEAETAWNEDALLTATYDEWLARARAALSAGQKERQ